MPDSFVIGSDKSKSFCLPKPLVARSTLYRGPQKCCYYDILISLQAYLGISYGNRNCIEIGSVKIKKQFSTTGAENQ